MIQIDLQTEGGHGRIECSAADAVPAANMSWLLPEGVSGVSWFNFTSHNGSHAVKGVLLLPVCSPWEHTVLCLINHPAFKEPETRSVTLPVCGMFDILSSGIACLYSRDLILFPERNGSLPALFFHMQLTQTSLSILRLSGKPVKNTQRWSALWTALFLRQP